MRFGFRFPNNRNLSGWIGSILVGATLVFLSQHIVSLSNRSQQDKIDLAEVNHIKYGLFSVNEWKKQLSGIVSDEISDFNLTGKNKKELKKHLEVQLNGLIDKVDEKIREKNKRSFKGRLKQSLINAFVDMKAIKAGIPGYADSIVAQLTKPGTEVKIKSMVNERVNKYLDNTFDEQDESDLDHVLARTASSDAPTARVKLETRIAENGRLIWLFTWILIGLSVLIFATLGFSKKPIAPPVFFLFFVNLLALLVAGVTSPMIDLVAKISQMSFVLLDHKIEFSNQILYFQSKSILDVFHVMITNPQIQMKLVGILVITFSIIFPLFKLLSMFIHYSNFRNLRESWLVKFFVLKSGKWSMTDVLVVAIFMAFIGFNGIISAQFAKLKSMASDISLLTTNGTSLQQGFYLFMAYAILSLFLSVFLTRKIEPMGRSDSSKALAT